MATAVAEKITIIGGVKTGDCPADIRILIGDTLVDIKADPQEIFGVFAGDLSYNLHGTVACPRESMAVVNGHGTLSIGNQKNTGAIGDGQAPRTM